MLTESQSQLCEKIEIEQRQSALARLWLDYVFLALAVAIALWAVSDAGGFSEPLFAALSAGFLFGIYLMGIRVDRERRILAALWRERTERR